MSKESRLKKSIRNMVTSILNKLIVVLSPFILRTIIIYKLGDEYTGLGSLFTSLLGVLSITELGFGTAVIYNLYKPLAEYNVEKVNALLAFYKKVYRAIGIVISLVGLLLMPFLKYLIKGSHPADINIYILYLMYLVNISIGYLLWGYKKSILIADQRNDVDNNINSVTNILCAGLQLVSLLLFEDYYVYVLVIPLCTIVNNVIISNTVNRRYPEYKACGVIEQEEKKKIINKVQALFYNRIGTTILTSSDNIIISAFLGLSILTYYNNYYSMVYTFISISYMITSSITSIIANSIVEEDIKKNRENFYVLNFMACVVSGFCTVYFLNLLQPFMFIWMGKKRMLKDSTVIFLCIYFYVWQSRRMVITYRDANGMWELDKYRPIIAATVNLISNILLVQIIGIDGILLSTIISMIFVEIPWETHILYKYYFNENIKHYYYNQFMYLIALLFASGVSYIVCKFIKVMGIEGFLLKGCACTLVCLIVYIIFFYHSKELKKSISYIKRIFHNSKKYK